MWWMLFDFTYLSCSLKIRKKGRAKKIKNISPPIILPSTISDLFWKIVKTKQKSLVWTKELIELWAKINSLCCILTEKKSWNKIRRQHCIFPLFFPPNQEKKKAFLFRWWSFKKQLLFFPGPKKKYFMFYPRTPLTIILVLVAYKSHRVCLSKRYVNKCRMYISTKEVYFLLYFERVKK